VPFFAGHVNPSFANAHDDYLEVGADLGAAGLLALSWGILVLLRAGWRARAALDAADRGLAAGGAAALALLAVAYFPFRLAPVAFAWVAAMAWICAAARLPAEGANAVEAEEAATAPTYRRWLLAGILALLVLVQAARAFARIVASATVHAVQQRVGAVTAMGPVPGGLVSAELRALAAAHRLDPAAIEPLAFRADLLLVAHRNAEAEAAYRTAIALEPRPEMLFNRGLLLWSLGRSDEAVVDLKRAVVLAPALERQVPPGAAPLVAAAPVAPLPGPPAR
jgi:tetratricopeptide (TPR) repeat protein